MSNSLLGAFSLGLLLCQGAATLILLSRLVKGAIRRPPLEPQTTTPNQLGAVTVVVPTLNEVDRIAPCLAGLSRQSYEVREILVVDSNSQDGTRDRVTAAAKTDPRFRLMTDDPLPPGWVGRPWALHNGFLYSSVQSQWILGIDADTEPQPGLVSSLLSAATEEGYDLVSLSPQFILEYPGEWWFQPALLMTLLYRFDSAGVRNQAPERVMANGQCFLCRRSVLEQLGGYTSAAGSFCDDVTLARNAAQQGFKVGFLDGAKVIRVRMYAGLAETWREWGRSIDLKDAANPAQQLGDLGLLFFTQALPLPLSMILWGCFGWDSFLSLRLAIGLNFFLVAIRFALLFAVKSSYYREGVSLARWLFWLSPLADILAVTRIFLSAVRVPKEWRGRVYSSFSSKD